LGGLRAITACRKHHRAGQGGKSGERRSNLHSELLESTVRSGRPRSFWSMRQAPCKSPRGVQLRPDLVPSTVHGALLCAFDPSLSHRQTMGSGKDAPDLLPGTLDLLILKTLGRGAMHGYGIAERLRLLSDDVLHVGESSLYPALQRLLLQGWVKAEWGASENNRRARYYTLTAAGRKRLASEREEFDRLILAIHKVLEA